jgi:transporter family-2 protein
MNLLSIPLLLALVAGTLVALQAPTNAMLSRALGSPISAAFVSFLVGTAALALIVLLSSSRGECAALRGLPWYAWLGGIYGAVFVAVAAYGAPRIGVAALLMAMIAGQLLMALILDHFGALGLERQPISLARAGGLALVIAGVLLVRRG